jgi:hypothetical protein
VRRYRESWIAACSSKTLRRDHALAAFEDGALAVGGVDGGQVAAGDDARPDGRSRVSATRSSSRAAASEALAGQHPVPVALRGDALQFQ